MRQLFADGKRSTQSVIWVLLPIFYGMAAIVFEWITTPPGDLRLVWLLMRLALYGLPFILAYLVANALVVGFLGITYELTWAEASAFWTRLRTGSPEGESLTVTREQFELLGDELLLRVGGPGYITITSGEAAVTERNGRFLRVLGPGKHALRRFEYVRSVVDLRQQEYRNQRQTVTLGEEPIYLITRDGIELQADVTFIYRICTDDATCNPDLNPATDLQTSHRPTLPTKDEPFPFGSEAVRRAAYAEIVVGDEVYTWERLAIYVIVDELRHIVNKITLDQLIDTRVHTLGPLQQLQDRLVLEARRKLKQYGIRLMNARIDTIHYPDVVRQHTMAHWKVPHEQDRQLKLAKLQSEIGLPLNGQPQTEEGIEIPQPIFIEQLAPSEQRTLARRRLSSVQQTLQRLIGDEAEE